VAVRERVQGLSRLFKHEFRFRADASFDEIFDDTIKTMIKADELVRCEGGEFAAGNRMFLGGEIEMREAINRPTLANAYLALKDEGYIQVRDGKLGLTESFASADSVEVIEGRIARFLDRQAPTSE
jgi:glycerol-3-phosphate O-acyltransferase